MSASSGALAVYGKVDNPQIFAIEMAKSYSAMAGVPLEQGAAVVMTCMAEGITARQYKRRYHTIMGSASMRADAMLAEFRMNHGGKFRKIERSAKAAEIEFTDNEANVYTERLTIEEAMASRDPWVDWKNHNKGLKDNWATPKDQTIMLWWALVRVSLGWICPELDAGVDENLGFMDDQPSQGPVVASVITSSRPTVAQIVAAGQANGNGASHAAQQTAAAQATGEVAASGTTEADGDQSDDVVDAEFEPAATAEVEEGEVASEADEADADPTPGTISPTQVRTLTELVEKLEMPHAAVESMLAKRNVNAIRSLSKEQAKEIIGKLRDKARQLAAVESGSPN